MLLDWQRPRRLPASATNISLHEHPGLTTHGTNDGRARDRHQDIIADAHVL
jgi:hypothetical protein